MFYLCLCEALERETSGYEDWTIKELQKHCKQAADKLKSTPGGEAKLKEQKAVASKIVCLWDDRPIIHERIKTLESISGLPVRAEFHADRGCVHSFIFGLPSKNIKTVFTYRKAKIFAEGVKIGRGLTGILNSQI